MQIQYFQEVQLLIMCKLFKLKHYPREIYNQYLFDVEL